MPRPRTGLTAFSLLSLAFVGLLACGGDVPDAAAEAAYETTSSTPTVQAAPEGLAGLLAAGEVVFGTFSGPTTREGGAAMGANPLLDFVFYSLEQPPFDLETMGVFVEGMVDAAAGGPRHPLALRIPAIRDGALQATQRVEEALAAGVDAIVFPHVETREDAALAVRSMGSDAWPGNPDGRLVSMLIVEDIIGVENVSDIVTTEGVSVVFAGPGDLSRAYEGDMEAVERAIQTVLAACLDAGVPCGITGGVDDIADRIQQGFRVFIVNELDAVPVGRRAAGRS